MVCIYVLVMVPYYTRMEWGMLLAFVVAWWSVWAEQAAAWSVSRAGGRPLEWRRSHLSEGTTSFPPIPWLPWLPTLEMDTLIDQRHLLLASFPGRSHRHHSITSSMKYGGEGGGDIMVTCNDVRFTEGRHMGGGVDLSPAVAVSICPRRC